MYAKWLGAPVLVLTLSAAGCGYNIKAASDYNPHVNFTNYGTFFMLKGNLTGSAVVDDRLASDVKNALASKGWVEVPEGEGQAAVIIHTANGEERSYDDFYQGWGGWQLRWAGDEAKFAENYKPGTVVVTIFDATS